MSNFSITMVRIKRVRLDRSVKVKKIGKNVNENMGSDTSQTKFMNEVSKKVLWAKGM